MVTSILTDPRSTEEERSECAGVIAQVTSPWVDSIHHVRGISDHAEDIIRELTGESRWPAIQDDHSDMVAMV